MKQTKKTYSIMKKTFKTLVFVIVGLLALASCEDVPAPYSVPDKNSNTGGKAGGTVEPQGEGTVASPFNVAAIVAKIKEMPAGVESTEEYYIKGKVSNVKTDAATITKYGNHTFEMIDEGDNSTVFTAFQVYGPGKKKFTSVDNIKVGDEVVVCGKVVNFKGNTPETVGQGAAYVVSINAAGGGGQGGDTPQEGIAVTCAEAVALVQAMEDGATSAETYTITGYITEVIGSVSRNQQTFWMADTKDGGRVFEAYWANLPEGVTEFKAGSKVTITGQLMKFINKTTSEVVPEIKNADVVILEDGGSGQGGDTPVEGTEVTCAQAVELVQALADGGTSTEVYTVTGYITEVFGNVSRNQQSFWMADTKDGGQVFEAYWANLPEGVSAFTVGSKVKITGNLLKYVKNGVVTPEIKNANVVILEAGDGGDTPEPPTPGPGGDTVTDLVNGDFESWVSESEPTGWKSASTASNAEVSKSVDARNGSFACKVGAPGTQNKRLATQEITLEAGSYTFSYYAKSTTTNVCQSRAGYVPVTNGSVGAYKYGGYVDINNSEWTLVSYDFELTSTTTLCLFASNPKETAGKTISQDILIDDATLVKK